MCDPPLAPRRAAPRWTDGRAGAFAPAPPTPPEEKPMKRSRRLSLAAVLVATLSASGGSAEPPLRRLLFPGRERLLGPHLRRRPSDEASEPEGEGDPPLRSLGRAPSHRTARRPRLRRSRWRPTGGRQGDRGTSRRAGRRRCLRDEDAPDAATYPLEVVARDGALLVTLNPPGLDLVRFPDRARIDRPPSERRLVPGEDDRTFRLERLPTAVCRARCLRRDCAVDDGVDAPVPAAVARFRRSEVLPRRTLRRLTRARSGRRRRTRRLASATVAA